MTLQDLLILIQATEHALHCDDYLRDDTRPKRENALKAVDNAQEYLDQFSLGITTDQERLEEGDTVEPSTRGKTLRLKHK